MKKQIINQALQTSVSVANKTENINDENSLLTKRSYKIKFLVDALRLVSSDEDISKEQLYIPDACEKYGFAEGEHNLGILLHFLADMLEE